MYRPAERDLAQFVFQCQQQIFEHLSLLIYHFDQSFDAIAKIVFIARVEPGHRDRVIDRLKLLKELTGE